MLLIWSRSALNETDIYFTLYITIEIQGVMSIVMNESVTQKSCQGFSTYD